MAKTKYRTFLNQKVPEFIMTDIKYLIFFVRDILTQFSFSTLKFKTLSFFFFTITNQ